MDLNSISCDSYRENLADSAEQGHQFPSVAFLPFWKDLGTVLWSLPESAKALMWRQDSETAFPGWGFSTWAQVSAVPALSFYFMCLWHIHRGWVWQGCNLQLKPSYVGACEHCWHCFDGWGTGTYWSNGERELRIDSMVNSVSVLPFCGFVMCGHSIGPDV